MLLPPHLQLLLPTLQLPTLASRRAAQGQHALQLLISLLQLVSLLQCEPLLVLLQQLPCIKVQAPLWLLRHSFHPLKQQRRQRSHHRQPLHAQAAAPPAHSYCQMQHQQ